METQCFTNQASDALETAWFVMKTSRYRILGEVGQGQFGKVFCGSDRVTGELVALKSLTHYKFTTRQFLRELAVLVRLKHPNIVSFHAVEYNETGRYIVMDYCQGGTLRQLMESKQSFGSLQKLQIIRDILLGLEHAHRHNVIHCDLKPENILLNVASHGWIAQIADFGIAQLMEKSQMSTGHSGHTGSPAYMAPERFYGQYSPESDIYAVGVLLYELLRGKRPFSGMPADIMKAHLNQPLRIPQSWPIVLQAIVRQALQKLPQHRYASAQAMRLALEAAIASLTHTKTSVAQAEANSDNVALSSGLVAEPLHASESSRPQLPSRNLTDRIVTILPDALQTYPGLPVRVDRLWARPQGCFIVTQYPDDIGLTLVQADSTLKFLGKLPCRNPESDPCHSPLEWLELDPQGRWLAAILPHVDAIANQTPFPESLHSQNKLQEGVPHCPDPASVLHVYQLPDLQQICQKPIDAPAHRLWMIDSRHILVGRPATLQLWNRRGHFYWSYPLPAPIRQAVPSSTDKNQFFAITDEENTTGLWINLRPFKIKRVALRFHADRICVLHWGYLLANPSGGLVGLNRRGRVMVRAQIPLGPGDRITAVSAIASTTLWLVIEHGTQQRLCTLDLRAYLPNSLLSF